MQELKDFQPMQLLNLLAKETITYYKLVGDGASVEESAQCNKRMDQIQMELDSRRYFNGENIFLRQARSKLPQYSL